MNFVDQLDASDRSVFLSINGAHAPWSDVLMHQVSEMLTWVPLYLFLMYLLQRRWGWKGMAWSVPVIALMITCSDSGSVMLFKNTVQRLRPCHVPELKELVHLIDGYCGGSFGFVSSHASNHFAIAVFMIAVLRGMPRWGVMALLFWAMVIAYSRVYLGVHYPGDVLVGALYGAVVGALFGLVHRRLAVRFLFQPSM